MTEPNAAAIKESFRAKVKTKRSLLDRFTGRNVAKDTVLPMTTTMMSAVIANNVTITASFEASLPPAVQKRRDELDVLFNGEAGYLANAKKKIAQGMALLDTIAKFEDVEFMTDTSTGGRALKLRPKVETMVEKYLAEETAAAKLGAGIPLISSAAEFEAYEAFIQQAIANTGSNTALMTEVVETFETMIEFEAIKAWVKQNPDQARGKLDKGLWAVDQGINALDYVGGVAEKVPDPHTQAAAEALKITVRVLKIAKAMADKAIRSADADRQIENYMKAHVKGSEQDEHTNDPKLMANMLAEKHKANLEIALVCADQVVATVGDAVPLMSTAWGVARSGITQAFDAYQDQRISLLEQALRGPAGDDLEAAAGFTTLEGAGEKIKGVGADLFEAFKSNVFNILAPLDTIQGVVIDRIGHKIAEMIVEKLPVNPAQGIDGNALKGMVDDLEDTFFNGVSVRPDSADPKAQAAQPDRPTQDKDGNPVEAVYGGIEKDDQGNEFRFVKIGGRRGALYAATGEFKVDGPQMNPVDTMLLDLVPSADTHGRPVAEVDLSGGFVTKDKVGLPGVNFAGSGIRVRVGPMWGYIAQQTGQFYPVKIEPTGKADWRSRSLIDNGYRESDGTEVKGTWYKPWPDQYYYAFVGPNGTEWAHGSDKTARGKGTSTDIMRSLQRAEVGAPSDLSIL